MNTTEAARKRAQWLSYCLDIGWDKNLLSELEKIWDSHYDENGNVKPIVEADAAPDGWMEELDMQKVAIDGDNYVAQFWYEQPENIKSKLRMAYRAGCISTAKPS